MRLVAHEITDHAPLFPQREQLLCEPQRIPLIFRAEDIRKIAKNGLLCLREILQLIYNTEVPKR
ncbi:hypothetical protein D3C75_1331090 [compost metagenome]